jgi:hypothetical protein
MKFPVKTMGVVALVAASVSLANPAEARWGRGWGGFGFGLAAAAIVGGAIAASTYPSYGYGYYPGYAYAYPAYSYGYYPSRAYYSYGYAYPNYGYAYYPRRSYYSYAYAPGLRWRAYRGW